jgi:MFS family permease
LNFITQYKGLGKSIYILVFANFINYTGNFVYPFLALILMSSRQLESDTIGLAMMIVSIAFVPGSLIGGNMADKVGRKKVVLISMFLKAILFILCALSVKNTPIMILLLTLASFVGGASGPAFGALVADLTTKETRRTAFSLLYLGVNFGMGISPVLAGFFYKKSIALLFTLDAITVLVAVLLMYIYVPETIKKQEKKLFRENKTIMEKRLGVLVGKNPILKIFLPVLFAYYFIYSQHSFSLPMQMEEYFKGDGAYLFGILMSVNSIVVITFTSVVTYLTKKYADSSLIAFSGLLLGGGFAMIGFVKSLPLLIIATVVWTIGEIMFATNSGAFIANNTPDEYRGRINSIVSITKSVALASGPWLIGHYLNLVDIKMVWPALFIIGLCYSLAAFSLGLKLKKQGEASLKETA